MRRGSNDRTEGSLKAEGAGLDELLTDTPTLMLENGALLQIEVTAQDAAECEFRSTLPR